MIIFDALGGDASAIKLESQTSTRSALFARNAFKIELTIKR